MNIFVISNIILLSQSRGHGGRVFGKVELRKLALKDIGMMGRWATDCQASDADAPYGFRHVVPSVISLAGVWALPAFAGVSALTGV